MNSIYKQWLKMAYESDNPTKFIHRFLSTQLKSAFTVSSVNSLITELKTTSSPVSQVWDECNPMRHVTKDVKVFQKTIEERKLDKQDLIAKFCYFATCMTHLFLEPTDVLIEAQPIFAYVEPNVPLPYIWFNVNEKLDTRVELVKHTMPDKNSTFKVMAIVVDIPGAMQMFKLSFDLSNGDCMASLHGDYTHIAIKSYEQQAHVQAVNKRLQCVIILTYEKILHGVYYNDGQNNFAHSCVYIAHY